MGCRNACICGGRCSESCYEAERYCGEAEDIYDELHGKSKEEEQYYKDMEEQEVKLTAKQYAMVSECIERVSANEREFDTDSEQTLKEVAEKFNADYMELNNVGKVL